MSFDSTTTPVVTRAPHFPTMYTHETCRNLVAFGLTPPQIAVVMRCTLEDLRTHYAEDIEHGLTRVNAQVQAALLHKALYDRDVPAMKLWLVNKANWRTGDKPGTGPELPGAAGQEGEMTVVERKTVIERMLRTATVANFDRAKVIEGTAVEVKKPNGVNGHGNGSANGAKHK